jgi:hypothetical protein
MVECVAWRIDAATTRARRQHKADKIGDGSGIKALDNDHKGPERRKPTGCMDEYKKRLETQNEIFERDDVGR